ncbi:hypothetical protein [Paenibacillus silvae]|uniref:hypothetical protein n=1 Tax=Paenibacillus silvae TaxID=1325358 RepID=UPI001E3BEDC3|nr:hypothetical protein [Paenibacillus silvae]
MTREVSGDLHNCLGGKSSLPGYFAKVLRMICFHIHPGGGTYHFDFAHPTDEIGAFIGL